MRKSLRRVNYRFCLQHYLKADEESQLKKNTAMKLCTNTFFKCEDVISRDHSEKFKIIFQEWKPWVVQCRSSKLSEHRAIKRGTQE